MDMPLKASPWSDLRKQIEKFQNFAIGLRRSWAKNDRKTRPTTRCLWLSSLVTLPQVNLRIPV